MALQVPKSDQFAQSKANVVAFSGTGRLVAVGGDLGVNVWKARNGEAVTSFRVTTRNQQIVPARSLDFCPTHPWIAVASVDSIKIFDGASGAEIRSLDGVFTKIAHLACSSDGASVAAVCDNEIVIWDFASGHITGRLSAPLTIRLAWSPDCNRIAAGCHNGRITVFDVRHANGHSVLRKSGPAIPSVAFSPDGALLAAGGRSGEVTVWNADTLDMVKQFKVGERSVNGLVFGQKGDRLFTGSNDQIRLWVPTTGREVLQLKDQQGRVLCLALDGSGTRLAAATESQLHQLWLWSAEPWLTKARSAE